MQLNFDKYNKKETAPTPTPETEMTTEQFEQMIEQEADKLGVSVDKLIEEIMQYGGPAEFKRKMENNNYIFEHNYRTNEREIVHKEGAVYDVRPEGQAIIDTHEASAKKHREASRSFAQGGAFLAGVGMLLEFWGDKLSNEIGMTGLGELVEKIKMEDVEHTDFILPTLITLAVGGALGTMIASLKETTKINKAKREAKKQELKHKMADVNLGK